VSPRFPSDAEEGHRRAAAKTVRHPSNVAMKPNVTIKRPAGVMVRLMPWLAALALLAPTSARAQFGAMGLPINTTLVISKPASLQIYAGQQIVTIGVGAKQYKFVLNDAYVDHPRIRWPDIWEQVRIYRPNFVMQGPHTEDIEHLAPGEMLTVKAMFAPLDRTFEVVFTEPGLGPFAPKTHY
jgi:hypothetical protein